MYAELQERYFVRHSTSSFASTSNSVVKSMDYDHISGQKYLLSFPTSTADLEIVYSGSSTDSTSFRHTLLTNDIESDYEDIKD